MNDELRDMISGRRLDRRAARTACRKQGMTTLREAGLRAIYNGVTTIEEVVRETVSGRGMTSDAVGAECGVARSVTHACGEMTLRE